MKMVRVKTSELSGIVLDWAVAKCEGRTVEIQPAEGPLPAYWEGEGNHTYWYSTNWAQGGPIIEREGISVVFCAGDLGEPRDYWIATTEQQGFSYGYGPYHEMDEERSIQIYKHEIKATGKTPLIAAMRCYVASKLGDSVEVPSELF